MHRPLSSRDAERNTECLELTDFDLAPRQRQTGKTGDLIIFPPAECDSKPSIRRRTGFHAGPRERAVLHSRLDHFGDSVDPSRAASFVAGAGRPGKEEPVLTSGQAAGHVPQPGDFPNIAYTSLLRIPPAATARTKMVKMSNRCELRGLGFVS